MKTNNECFHVIRDILNEGTEPETFWKYHPAPLKSGWFETLRRDASIDRNKTSEYLLLPSPSWRRSESVAALGNENVCTFVTDTLPYIRVGGGLFSKICYLLVFKSVDLTQSELVCFGSAQ
jgi:hypothetical protein